ncbi:hypothetical protein CH275_25330 [Rhodococcus sp. 06-235-1A]|uniref:hypothetical protein n=1 Tax=Rhodococcus sp. 06-235-1A TaxID=2022508 RepID=UPI000B9B5EF6|nr:hypothetical protein [Rhodococcus sp. 06-235-1A]OZC97452.1 hypothetical protein CH275_25330 [Rhodococcus sp. 06-235-1A]
METLKHTLDSLWQVVLVGLLLGAGLPAIFAVGLKALSVGEPSDDTAGAGTTRVARPAVATAAAVVCFAVVVVAIVAGILFIMKNFLDTTFGISVF